MTLTEELSTYPSDRAIKWAQAKKLAYSIYGSMRSTSAVLDGDSWSPAGYTPDGKIPIQNGVDVILFPLIQDGDVINIVAFEPNKKPLQLYMRAPDCNLWAVLEMIEGVMS